ncbi:MAG: polymerase subunit delta [Thermomicrobiales bacterium]|jgi:DNA polymerase-3 subunit delta'|nr:polymerase subunit delta [Thermomicrobiales bacterium]
MVRGRVRHAYLFAGAEGIGKTTLSRAFCQALICQEPPDLGVSCGGCLACRKIARSVHPDVQTFSLAGQAAGQKGTKNISLTIETVRELCATASLRPMEGRWRVLIVEDAETLQGIAQEALLKTLEEPPAFMVMILLANDAEVLLPTIRSRCQVVELRPVHRSVIRDGLIASGVPADRADELAALAAGSPGWARRAVDEPKLVEQRRQAVVRALDWITGSGYERLVAAVRIGDSFTKRRSETFADLDTLLGVWRDALLLRAGQPDYLTFRGQRDRLDDVAGAWPIEAVHRAVRSVQECIADLEANVRPRLALEAMVLQWPTQQSQLSPRR